MSKYRGSKTKDNELYVSLGLKEAKLIHTGLHTLKNMINMNKNIVVLDMDYVQARIDAFGEHIKELEKDEVAND